MLLDELAAAIVGLDSNDPQELKRIQSLIAQYRGESTRTAAELKLTDQAQAVVSRLLAGSAKDLDAALKELGDCISELQEPPAAAPAAPAPATEETGLENDPEILAEFISDATDHLQNAESSLLALEADPNDQENLNKVFRAFHSTKGTASFLGLNAIKELAHNGEMLLDRARKKELELKGRYADLALETADTLQSMVKTLAQTTGGASALPANYDDLMQRLSAPADAAKTASAPAAAPAPAPSATPKPAAASPAPTPAPATPAPQPQPEPAAPASAAPVFETRPAASPVRTASGSAPAPASPPPAVPAAADKEAAANSQSMVPTVRVATDKLDGLINRVGELVIIHAMIAQYEDKLGVRNQGWSSNILQLERITRELQDLSMSLRMVPLKPTFQKMERLVRDMARKSGKVIRFVTEGEDTEIDRNMVESLNDPLVHMIRNAIDHGIEPPDKRRAAGKPDAGTLILRAYHGAGSVVIEMRDDGQGLNRSRILAKAVERNLVEPNRELTDAEVFKLIFMPGFSTAEKVTDISGRGVGLDVVKKNIEALQGRVEINSVPGKSTVFTMRIPLTLAIIEGMLLQVGDRQYILPTLSVQKAFRPAREDLLTLTEEGEMVKARGHLHPIYRLHELFNVNNAIQDPAEALLILVEHEGDICALLADTLVGQQQVVIKSMPDNLGKVAGVSGAAILGDGRIGLILDVGSIMRFARGKTSLIQLATV
ncbi:MAG: chemotaxis protein CheA [candidate division FCPU426 bacterium]